MLCTEETTIISEITPNAGDLVRFRFLDGKLTDNIHHMKEGLGIVVAINDRSFCVCVRGKMIDACWITEIVKSV